MLFKSDRKWWSEKNNRPTLHQGLDLCLYKDKSGDTIHVKPNAKIPVFFAGNIVNIIDDFLGQTIFVKHEDVNQEKGLTLYTIYGHCRPLPEIENGISIPEGKIIATIADTKAMAHKIAPHLHVSTAWISDRIPPHSLDWTTINHHKHTISLIDPLTMINQTTDL